MNEVAAATACRLVGMKKNRSLLAAGFVPALSAVLKSAQPPVQHLILQPLLSLACCLDVRDGTYGNEVSDVAAAVGSVLRAEQPLTQKDALIGLVQLLEHHRSLQYSRTSLAYSGLMREQRQRSEGYDKSSQQVRDAFVAALPSLVTRLQTGEADVSLDIIAFIAQGSNEDGLKQAVPAVVALLDQLSHQQGALSAIRLMSHLSSEIKGLFVAAGALPKLRRLMSTRNLDTVSDPKPILERLLA